MAAKLPDWFKGGGDGRARGGCVEVIVGSVCGGREVSSNVNVEVDDDGRCGRRYGDKGLGVSCGGEGYRTGSEAAAASEQRGSGSGGSDRARLRDASLVDGVFLSSIFCLSLTVVPLLVWLFRWRKFLRNIEPVARDVASHATF